MQFTVDGSGNVIVGGQTLTTIPIGSWVHFEATQRVACDATGSWSLKVTAQRELTFSGLSGTPIQRLGWAGFVSDGNAATVAYIDNVKFSTSLP